MSKRHIQDSLVSESIQRVLDTDRDTEKKTKVKMKEPWHVGQRGGVFRIFENSVQKKIKKKLVESDSVKNREDNLNLRTSWLRYSKSTKRTNVDL